MFRWCLVSRKHRGIELGRLFRLSHRIEKAEKLLYPSHLQRGVNSVADTDQGERATLLVVRDVGTNQRSDSGGVDIRNGGEIENQRVCIFGANGGLELKQRSEHDGALQAENSLAGLDTVEIVDGKRLL
jgi:hypothetical protein